MHKRRPRIREVYRSVRKPVPPPTRVEPDRREKMRSKRDKKEVEDYMKRGRRSENTREEKRNDT